MFIYKNRNRSSEECKKKKNVKNHLVFINHPSSIRTKLSQTDEDVHIQVHWMAEKLIMILSGSFQGAGQIYYQYFLINLCSPTVFMINNF